LSRLIDAEVTQQGQLKSPIDHVDRANMNSSQSITSTPKSTFW